MVLCQRSECLDKRNQRTREEQTYHAYTPPLKSWIIRPTARHLPTLIDPKAPTAPTTQHLKQPHNPLPWYIRPKPRNSVQHKGGQWVCGEEVAVEECEEIEEEGWDNKGAFG